MARIQISYVFLVALIGASAGAESRVELLRSPNRGIQPQAVIDDAGTLHLVYFAGEPDAGDLYYVQKAADGSEWSAPARVNSREKSARRNGAISHAQLALGPGGRIHVTWFNMQPPKFFYTRSRADGPGFEEQRSLVEEHVVGVEAGASIAVNGRGDVYLVWHAGDIDAEDERGVYLLRSRDGGVTFGPETRIDDGRGVCACCGLSGLANDNDVFVSYRAATDRVDRDLTLLTSVDDAPEFTARKLHAWKIPACPVSTTRLAVGPKNRALIAWETEGQVFFAAADALDIVPAPGAPSARRKNPVVAVNASNEVLLVWGDGPGWRSGGALHWQIFDSTWRATSDSGHADTMADFSVPTAVVKPDGTFLVIY